MSSTSPVTKDIRFIAVVGPTASGKSAVALELAKRCQGEIVCCDSVQLYRGFDIGSAKPSLAEQAEVPHHLFDSLAPTEPCDAGTYAEKARVCIEEIRSRGCMPIVTGGTGLYLRALAGENWNADLPTDENLRIELKKRTSESLFTELCERDPLRASQVHQNDRFRVVRALEIILLTGSVVPQPSKLVEADRDHLVLVMDPPRSDLLKAIHLRTQAMLDIGLVNEVQSLLAQGVAPTVKPMTSIGYAEVLQYLDEKLSLMELQNRIELSTRQYSKRQNTWFKKIPRDFTLAHPQELSKILPQLLERLT